MLSPAQKGVRVKQVYSELNRKFEEEETQRLAVQQKLPYINLYGYPVDPQSLVIVPEEQAEAYRVGVFFKEGRSVKLATTGHTKQVDKIIKEITAKGYTVDEYIISESSLKHLLSGYKTVLKTERKSDEIKIKSSDPKYKVNALQDLSVHLVSVSATELLDTLIAAALNLDASDIHMEPEGKTTKIRFRIDGVLQDVAGLETTMHLQLVSRIKIISKMKLNITATPQDGSFSLTYDGNRVDIRASVLPSAYGESIVMRILRQDKGSLKFEELGIMGRAKEQILQEMTKPNGMILTTGPTGSGKTTTLYAILNKLNEPGVKIITLEDPVEYKIAGITQSPVNGQQGLTFAEGLRAILRQDPDIVMIGEMRDFETAETAAQAALTGHIVLSTLHTNDAPSAIPRLLDMGIKPFVLAPAINAIIAQRLVRKICLDCKVAYKLPEHVQKRVEMILKTIPKASQADIPTKLNFYHSPGCSKCKGLGYKGRLGVYEVFTISDEIEKMIMKNASTTEIRNQAIAEGMITMAQDGLLKALKGITDVEEVFRVVEE